MDGCSNAGLAKEVEEELAARTFIRKWDMKIWSTNRDQYYAMTKIELMDGFQPEDIEDEVESIFTQREVKSCVQIRIQRNKEIKLE